jgi:hypothetical protein
VEAVLFDEHEIRSAITDVKASPACQVLIKPLSVDGAPTHRTHRPKLGLTALCPSSKLKL